MAKVPGDVAYLCIVILLCSLGGRAFGGELPISDFNSGIAGWTFTNGPEFPGATGGIDAGAGYQGQGLEVSFDLHGGHYVGAEYQLPIPITAAAIGFWANSPPGTRLTLRVVDQTGQYLQYDANRPLSSLGSPAGWYRQVVELDLPDLFFGGANDGTLHEPIQALSLLTALLASQANPIGTVGFDEVVAETDLDLTVDPAGPLDPAFPGVTDLASDLGINVHSNTDAVGLGLMNDAGFIWVRQDLTWATVETSPGVYDFSVYDGLFSLLDGLGMKPLFLFDYTNPLYDSGNPPSSAAGIAAFAAYAHAAAAHYAGRGARWEVWNEENGEFWAPAPDALAYSALSAPTIAAVHAGDPAALVTTGGLAGFDFAYLAEVLDAGGAVGADAVGVHPYRYDQPETATDELLFMRAMVAGALPSAPPIWDTEWGYTPGYLDLSVPDSGPYTAADFDGQARYDVRELITAKALGFTFPVYYDALDDCTNLYSAGCNFGLLNDDYSVTPAMTAVTTFTSLAAGRVWRGFLQLIPSTVYGLRLDGPLDSLVILWNSLPGSSISVTLPAGVSGVDMLGQSLQTVPLDGGQVFALSEVAGPVYLSAHLPGIGDAGPTDAGPTDAGPTDAGPTDAGPSAPDAGGSDGGAARDAGSHSDAGPASDAGTKLDGGPTGTRSSGCGCGSGASGASGLLWLVAAWGLAVKPRRRRTRMPKP